MGRHRFFISKDQMRKDEVFLSGYQARQITQVLRLRPEDKITVLDNEGWEYEIALQTTRADRVHGHVVGKWPVDSEPQIFLTLYQSMLKQDKFEWILQKGTELGVAAFVPVITERSVVRLDKLKRNKVERWQRIICEAAEQSGRGLLPTLAKPLDFTAALEEMRRCDVAIIPWTGERATTIAEVMGEKNGDGPPPHRTAALLLGPEGGFSDDEIQLAQEAHVTPVTLGPRILRAETAAIVTATLALYEAGEMRRGPQ